MQLRVIALMFLLGIHSASADVYEAPRKKCQKLSPDHRWIELTDNKDQSIAGFCEVDKVKDGPTMEAYPGTDTVKKEGSMKKGQMHGEWKRYFSNGKPKDEGNWFEGAPDGDWKFWREDGTLTSRGQFSKGTKICTWENWNATGEKSVEELPAADGGSCTKFSFKTNQFSLYGMYLHQSPILYLISGGATWEPTLRHLPSSLYLRFPVSVFANRGSSGSLFPSVDAGLRLGVTLFQKLSLETGMGYQWWISNGVSSAPSLAARVLYAVNFWKITHFWVGYSVFPFPDVTHEPKVGVMFSL